MVVFGLNLKFNGGNSSMIGKIQLPNHTLLPANSDLKIYIGVTVILSYRL